MKVLFNTWSGAFFNPGGGEVQLLSTKLAMEARGVEVDLYNQWAPQKDIDLFHQFSIQYGVNYVVDAYKQLGKKVALSTILWADIPQSEHYYWQIRDLLVKSDILFTNSDAESQKISKGFDIDLGKFHKTRNSITNDFLSMGDAELFKKEYGIDGDFVLTVGNIDRRKNTGMLVDVCKELGLKLVVIGAIRDFEYFKEFSSSYGGVNFLGAVSDPTLIKSAYRACRVFALPSLCETPGIAALEAASQNASLVITNQGSTEEYFEDYAVYVDPNSRDSLKNGLRAGMERTVSSTQSEYIRGQYTWDRTALDVLDGYSKIEL